MNLGIWQGFVKLHKEFGHVDFFVNSSRLFKDLKKIKICHAMDLTLGQIKLRKPFL
jgi:hypothetical protein